MWEMVWIFMHPVIHVLGFLTLIVLTVLAIGMVIKTFWKVFVAIGIIFFLVIIIFFFLGAQISI